MPEPQSPLFIVDNTDEDWKVSSYLSQWGDLSRQMDIATGYFEIGALLGLKENWQKVDKIRILMGDEVSKRTKPAFLQGLRKITDTLDASLEQEKRKNDFLKGVPAIVEAIRSGKIECRVYRKDKFHAKAYITHGRAAVIGSFALVGSSNFTYPGLNDNVELNVQIGGPQVALLQEWYERHWADAEDVTAEVLRTLDRHIALRSPFEIWFKALHEYLRGHELSPDAWDQNHSVIYPMLAKYQRDAYKNLVQISRRFGAGFLCDGVGLGKTYVGLMLIERMVMHEGKRVVVFAPKAAREDVWEPAVERLLPGLNSDFQSFVAYNHTDLQRTGKWPAKLARTLKDADVVIIDEAHHFRNPGVAGTATKEKSRYRMLQDYLNQPDGREKQFYLLTATPVNNSIHDFRHILNLVTNNDEAYFTKGARNLGIHSIRRYFIEVEKKMLGAAHDGGGAGEGEQGFFQLEEMLQTESLFNELVVQRSRSYVRASERLQERNNVLFPEREPPRVAPYKLKITYGRLLDSVERAFNKQKPLFALAIYNPLGYSKRPPEEGEATVFDINRQKQVVALIRTQFLKRFESSAKAFEMSCWRLLKKLLAWVEIHAESDHEARRLERWKLKNAELINFAQAKQPELWENPYAEDEEEFLTQDDLDGVNRLDTDSFKIAEMLDDTFDDMNQVAEFLDLVKEVRPERDGKLTAIAKLLTEDPDLTGRKVILFTEFTDTARYLETHLKEKGITGIERIDGSSSQRQRSDVIHRFAPFYNGKEREPDLAEAIRILIATDVLAEGLNLQDADRLINFDLHWNPVRLMQRIGRVDRRLNPSTEASLLSANPHLAGSRGRVVYWNFLPPEELESLLALYNRVNKKTLVISKAFGIEGRQLLHPDDAFDPVREINEQFEGQQTESEKLALEYDHLVAAHPELAATLDGLPLKVFSGKEVPACGTRAVFFCHRIPRADPELIETDGGGLRWSEKAGETVWTLVDAEGKCLTTDPSAMAALIRSTPDTPRSTAFRQEDLAKLRAMVEKDLVQSHLRALQAPVGITPVLKCWMEIH